tara:strand:- start:1665 stop:1979 length:315 start_codon:yes stop_codon:yes gene_type:complete
MKKNLLSIIIVLIFALTGCVATITPDVTYTKKPAYVYYDNLYGTYIYLPYKMRITSNRYIYRKHIKNYRGKYKAYKRNIRFYKPKVKKTFKKSKKKKRKRGCPH